MNWRKNSVPAILIFSLIILLAGCSKENKAVDANQGTSLNNIKASDTVTANVSFTVMDSKSQPI